MTPTTIDVSHLPPGAFGYRSLMWWGTVGIILIEGTVFGLAVVMYFYVLTHTPTWPPGLTAPPDLLWGTVNTALLLVSAIPNALTKRAAERVDLAWTRRWLMLGLVVGVGFNIVRVLEFRHLNVAWNHDAYGSLVWLLLGLHTTHIVTDVLDSAVLAALLYLGPVEEIRFVDAEENCVYWYFVVLAWLPIYGVLYWAPRFW